jgi:hypothetical protein
LYKVVAKSIVMAVGFDVTSESHTGTEGSTSEASFNWSHPGGGSAVGAYVFVGQVGGGDSITSVTYGGNAMTEDTSAADISAEQGRIELYKLESSVPTGSQTVEVTRTNNTREMWACCITVTATGGVVELTGQFVEEDNQALTEENVDDGSPGTSSLRICGLYSGLNTPGSEGANSTMAHEIDVGTKWLAVCYETSVGQGSRPVGFSAGSDDVAAIYAAIREPGAAPAGPTQYMTLLGVGN